MPKHRAPDVVLASGLAEDGYIPVDSSTLRTRFDDVYAVGDVATVGRAEGRRVRRGRRQGRGRRDHRGACGARAIPTATPGSGSCYIEFGAGRVGRVDVDFLGGPKPTGTYRAPSEALVAEKSEFGSSRRARWF